MICAVYNPYLDTLGGGERYMVGAILAFEKAGYRVEVEWPEADILEKLEGRFGVKFAKTKIVSSVGRGDGYDACFWFSDGSVPTLRSRNNILHFQAPFTHTNGRTLINRMKFFRIKNVVVNSKFTKGFIDKEFGLTSRVVYPPVSVREFKPRRKQNIVCYVGRFSRLAQAKRQDVLIGVFKKFSRINKGWKLVLAGGAEVGNDEYTNALRVSAKNYPVEILESPSFSEIKELLGVSKMFWSAAGYGVDELLEPMKVEHFGITIVEAMAAKAVPLVVAKGGPKEIVVDGKSGFLWVRKDELLSKAQKLAGDFSLWREMASAASVASAKFSQESFEEEFLKLL